jgi:hypothetical protein
MERNSFFLQELGSNSPGFQELESQKKGSQKGMHNLDPSHLLQGGQGEAGSGGGVIVNRGYVVSINLATI